MMKISFPPNHPEELLLRSDVRPYEPLPQRVPVVTYCIIFICVLLHLLASQAAGAGTGDFAFTQAQIRLGAMNVADPWSEPIWKYLTSCFLHHDLMHLGFNMLWIYQLGSLMERALGSLKLLLFVVVTGFASSAFQVSFEGVGIGMSGVVYAMVGFMWAAWPRWTGFLEKFNGNTVQFLLFWQVLCILLTVSGTYNIGNTAHLSGLVLGGVIGLWACHGNKRGAKWLALSILLVAMSGVVAVWSPWNQTYQLHKLEQTGAYRNLTPQELKEFYEWKLLRDSLAQPRK